MNIRMYDCQFGDCFRVDPEDDSYYPLYVDFGTRSIPSGKNARYDDIINDMPDRMDFLLTHYHEDHYDGVIYLMNHKSQYNKVFQNIYIPDIWNLNCSVDIVKLILLRGLLWRYHINKSVTLLTFLSSICSMNGKIHFVDCGDSIQGKYTVLWPETNQIEPCIDYDEDSLNEIAKQTVRIMQTVRSENGAPTENAVSMLDALNDRYINLPGPVGFDFTAKVRLSKWNNDISIVFHSTTAVKRNILFTGDVPQKYWPKIEHNISNDPLAIGGNYSVIKVPHHGTHDYYYDFASKVCDESVVLIPNGNIKNWLIDDDYCLLNPLIRLTVCSSNNCCKALQLNGHVCRCANNHIIDRSGSFYYDV